VHSDWILSHVFVIGRIERIVCLRPLCFTKLYENDFFNRCVSCWNFVPYTVVNAGSISCFKRFLSDVDSSSFACCTYF